jgi:hypothetical protein
MEPVIKETNSTERELPELHEKQFKGSNLSEHAREMLKITRDTEFLQSFLRVNIAAEAEADDSNRPRHKGLKKLADEKAAVLLPPLQHLQDQQQQQQLEQQEEEQKRQAETAAERHKKVRSTESEEGKNAGKTTFSQLTKDLKLRKGPKRGRRRSRVRRQEECYTDKDRAAAVNMGSHDIKQSLKMKRRLDRSRALQIPEEAEPGTLLALGSRQMRSGDINTAINFVHKVMFHMAGMAPLGGISAPLGLFCALSLSFSLYLCLPPNAQYLFYRPKSFQRGTFFPLARGMWLSVHSDYFPRINR